MNKKSKRRTNDASGIKTLIASLSIAAMIALWSIFSNQDRIAQLTVEQGQGNSEQTNTLLVEPMPTLVNIEFPDGQMVTVEEAQEDLRSVSAPVVSRPSSNPVVVSGSPQVLQSSANTTTTTTKSSG